MGRPVARVVPYKPKQNGSRLGFAAGQVRLAENFDEWHEHEAHALGMID
jgi:antitoxin (DNA-binding transcriptional repressor) of toxin-antitoxin stability system